MSVTSFRTRVKCKGIKFASILKTLKGLRVFDIVKDFKQPQDLCIAKYVKQGKTKMMDSLYSLVLFIKFLLKNHLKMY